MILIEIYWQEATGVDAILSASPQAKAPSVGEELVVSSPAGLDHGEAVEVGEPDAQGKVRVVVKTVDRCAKYVAGQKLSIYRAGQG